MQNMYFDVYGLTNSLNLLYTNSSFILEYVFTPLAIIVLVTVLLYLPVFMLFLLRPTSQIFRKNSEYEQRYELLRTYVFRANELISKIDSKALSAEQKKSLSADIGAFIDNSKSFRGKRKAN
jgi:hypothetical protein